MSQQRQGLRWFQILGFAVLVLLVGFGAGSFARSKTSKAATGSDSVSTSAPVAPTLAGAVTAGAGGTGLAVDGHTPIGYPHTCEGAVAAATNYATTAAQDAWVGAGGSALLAQISTGMDPARVAYYVAGQTTSQNLHLTKVAHPEWGGYGVESCSPNIATIHIWTCVVVSTTAAMRECHVADVTVIWAGGDWKLHGYEIPAEMPLTADADKAHAGADPLPTQTRRAVLSTTKWQEFANAPQ